MPTVSPTTATSDDSYSLLRCERACSFSFKEMIDLFAQKAEEDIGIFRIGGPLFSLGDSVLNDFFYAEINKLYFEKKRVSTETTQVLEIRTLMVEALIRC